MTSSGHARTRRYACDVTIAHSRRPNSSVTLSSSDARGIKGHISLGQWQRQERFFSVTRSSRAACPCGFGVSKRLAHDDHFLCLRTVGVREVGLDSFDRGEHQRFATELSLADQTLPRQASARRHPLQRGGFAMYYLRQSSLDDKQHSNYNVLDEHVELVCFGSSLEVGAASSKIGTCWDLQ